MKTLGLFFIFLSFFTSFAFAEKVAERLILEDFSEDKAGDFPSRFKAYPFQKQKAKKIYSVQEEGSTRYLHAVDPGENGIPVLRKVKWNTNEWPRFSWRWRVRALPKMAESQDTACTVYVIFSDFNGYTLKYVWSTTLPIGTIHEDKPGKFFTIVQESGSRRLNQWVTVDLDIPKEFRRHFKSEPPRQDLTGFGLLTDGDDTHSPSACDYADFQVLK